MDELLLLRSCLLPGAAGCRLGDGEKSGSILGIERIELNRLLTGVGQSEVNAAVLGQVDNVDTTDRGGLFLVGEFGVLLNQILDLILGENLALADCVDGDGTVRNALLNQILLYAVDAALREGLVELIR